MQSLIQESTRMIDEGTVNTSVLASKTPKIIEVVKGTRDATHKNGQTVIRSVKIFFGKMTQCFWDQYTYGVGQEQYGYSDSIEEALKIPFLHSGSKTTPDGHCMVNRDGRTLYVENEKGEWIALVHQGMQYDYSETDSTEWQNHAKELNKFVAVERAAEIFENCKAQGRNKNSVQKV